MTSGLDVVRPSTSLGMKTVWSTTSIIPSEVEGRTNGLEA
jgi:hypothetical protein